MEKGDIIYIDSLEDLEAHVFTIGYTSEGETILFILCNKGKPVFTSLTDCYMTDDCNHIENIMSASDEPRRFNGLLFSYNISDIVSVTTIKSPLHPVMSVIDEYKKLGHSVYSTGTGNEKYGCIEYCMNVKNILTCVTCTGNAIQL